MGDYSSFMIGELKIGWKWYTPPVLVFLFGKDDVYVVMDREGDDVPEEYLSEAGFRTTAAAALERLSSVGYTGDFFVRIYSSFTEALNDDYWSSLEMALEDQYPDQSIDVAIRRHVSRFQSTSPAEDLYLFIQLLQESARSPHRKTIDLVFPKQNVWRRAPRLALLPITHSHNTLWQVADVLNDYVTANVLKVPPGLHRALVMFDLDRMRELEDVLLLLFSFVYLRSVPGETEVKLDVGDLLGDTEDPIGDTMATYEQMPTQIIDKVKLYNEAFAFLLRDNPLLSKMYVSHRLRDQWNQVLTESNAHSKGRILEDFVATLLGSVPGLQVEDKRVNLGDQEIDVILSNHVDDAFWTALASPVIIVECKNWASKVGADEVRSFEAKIRDHANYCSLGFCVSANGFSEDCQRALQRLGRSTQKLVFVGPSDIERLWRDHLEPLKWLVRFPLRLISSKGQSHCCLKSLAGAHTTLSLTG